MKKKMPDFIDSFKSIYGENPEEMSEELKRCLSAVLIFIEAEHGAFLKTKEALLATCGNLKTFLEREIEDKGNPDQEAARGAAVALVYLRKAVLERFIAGTAVDYLSSSISTATYYETYVQHSQALKLPVETREEIENGVKKLLESFKSELKKTPNA